MKNRLVKALVKKKKYRQRCQEYLSDENLSSEDEMEIQQLYLGKIISNRYIILSYISRGTFSRTWLVWDSQEDSFKAAKYFSLDSFEEANNEINIHTQLGYNPYISKLFESITIQNHIILIYELLGVSIYDILNDLTQNLYTIEKDIVNKIIKDLLIGLQGLHSKHIVHLDIKPENMLTTIYTNRIKHIIAEFKAQNPKKTYDTLFNKELELANDKLNKANVYKKKLIKRKIKLRSLKELYIPILDNFNEEYDFNLIQAGDFKVKLIDLGNSDYEETIKEEKEDQYLKYYRCPFDDYYSCKSDIWALGCIYYELLTGGDYLCKYDNALLFKYFGNPQDTTMSYEPNSLKEKVGTNQLSYFLMYDQHLRLNSEHLIKLF